MKLFRMIAVAGALAMFLGTTGSAFAELDGTVRGGAFYRTTDSDNPGKGKSKATKTKVTVSGTDDTDGDSGRATISEHTPGSKPTVNLSLELDCVVVDGDTAYASGTDRAGDRHYIVVEDGGEPGRGNDEFGTAEDNVQRTLLFLTGFDCGAAGISTSPVDGGNLQVNAAE